MDTKEIQTKTDNIINAIDKKLDVNHDVNHTMMHLIEEIGELAKQINNKNIRHIEQDKANIEEELADILLLTIRLANIYNVDTERAIIGKINKLKQRHNL